MSKVYFVTLPNGYFGNAPESWQTLDVEKMASSVLASGYEVVYTDISEILNFDLTDKDYVVYTAADNDELNRYILDVLYFVNKKATLVPSYDVMKAYENKGFQTLYRKAAGLDCLNEDYYFDLLEYNKPKPFVYKDVMGAGGSSVELVSSNKKWDRLISNKIKLSFVQKVKNIIRKKQLTAYEYSLYEYKYRKFNRFVTQDFIPSLDCDYRVLIFSDKYYAMKRDVRKNDFRASGSKKFSFERIPIEVIEYARYVFSKIDAPFLSIDIAYSLDDSKCYLIEYQGLSFGTSALRHSLGYYKMINDQWDFVSKDSDLEEEYSKAILWYINKNE